MTTDVASTPEERPWSLWLRQVGAVLRIELRKILRGARSIPTWGLALLPTFVTGAIAIAFVQGWIRESPAAGMMRYALVYQNFVLRFVVFSGCAWIFTNLYRGEIIDRSLHYWFLAPIRRDVLVVAKFASGLVASTLVFTTATALSIFLVLAPHGWAIASEHLFSRGGLGDAAAYLGVTMLACVGYGALFLLTGVLFRNPILPALGLLLLESINFLLPPLLKKVSVVYWLASLCPVRVSQGPIAMVADPAPLIVSAPGLLALAAITVTLAARRMRREEIAYGID